MYSHAYGQPCLVMLVVQLKGTWGPTIVSSATRGREELKGSRAGLDGCP